jgi:hypothetical protein
MEDWDVGKGDGSCWERSTRGWRRDCDYTKLLQRPRSHKTKTKNFPAIGENFQFRQLDKKNLWNLFYLMVERSWLSK